jgi:hypothetical protein
MRLSLLTRQPNLLGCRVNNDNKRLIGLRFLGSDRSGRISISVKPGETAVTPERAQRIHGSITR